MTDDSDRPVVVAQVDNEVEATVMIGALEAEGIAARMVGEFTASFRAEAPGLISIVVRHADAGRARAVLDQVGGPEAAS